jgi:hypothetical protein
LGFESKALPRISLFIVGGKMIIPIKGIRKWRISHDQLNWIIQKKRPSNKPPNDWKNRYYFSNSRRGLEAMIKTLITIGIDDSKITNLKALSTHISKLERNLLDTIQTLFEKTGGIAPETERTQAVRKGVKKKAKKRKTKK